MNATPCRIRLAAKQRARIRAGELRIERDRRRGKAKRIAAIVAVTVGALIVLGSVGIYAYAKHIEKTMQRTSSRRKLNRPEQPNPIALQPLVRSPRPASVRTR
jgi:cytochrome c-type biogenesis protein CcmH/NrfG